MNYSVERIRVVWIITEVASTDFSPEPSSILQKKEKGDQGKAGHVWGEQHHSDTVGESSNLISSEAAPESVITLSIELS